MLSEGELFRDSQAICAAAILAHRGAVKLGHVRQRAEEAVGARWIRNGLRIEWPLKVSRPAGAQKLSPDTLLYCRREIATFDEVSGYGSVSQRSPPGAFDAFSAEAASDNDMHRHPPFSPGEALRESVEVRRRGEPYFTAKGETVVVDAHHHTLYPGENFSPRPMHGNEAREENRCRESQLR